MSERLGKIWPHLRAALIALHVLAITLIALPSPEGGMRRSAWKSPTVQDEFRAWTQRLNAVGIGLTTPELEDLAWEWAETYEGGRQVVLAPFRPYYRHCGTWQSWRMFVAPHRYPARLHIELQDADGSWRNLYVARSPEFTWRATQLDNDRMRAAIFRYGWGHYRSHFVRFANWVAREAAVEFPHAQRVQVRFYRYRTPSPEEVRSSTQPKGKFERSILLELAKLRAGR